MKKVIEFILMLFALPGATCIGPIGSVQTFFAAIDGECSVGFHVAIVAYWMWSTWYILWTSRKEG